MEFVQESMKDEKMLKIIGFNKAKKYLLEINNKKTINNITNPNRSILFQKKLNILGLNGVDS